MDLKLRAEEASSGSSFWIELVGNIVCETRNGGRRIVEDKHFEKSGEIKLILLIGSKRIGDAIYDGLRVPITRLRSRLDRMSLVVVVNKFECEDLFLYTDIPWPNFVELGHKIATPEEIRENARKTVERRNAQREHLKGRKF